MNHDPIIPHHHPVKVRLLSTSVVDCLKAQILGGRESKQRSSGGVLFRGISSVRKVKKSVTLGLRARHCGACVRIKYLGGEPLGFGDVSAGLDSLGKIRSLKKWIIS